METSILAKLILVHNPGCSKSRAALAILNEKGLQPEIIDYIDSPPSPGDIAHWLDLLGMQARDLMRQDEDEYRELGLDNPALDNDQLIDAMCRHPRLIQRPIVISADRALIARPPERVLDML